MHAIPGGAVTTFTPRARHQGYRGLMSGGLLAAIFDCLHYRVSVLEGVLTAVTARLEVDYRAPIRLGQRLYLEARLGARRGRVVESVAVARLPDGAVAAESRAVYVEVPRARLPRRRDAARSADPLP
jgi:acyl-CoA thioesterase FadM